SDDLTGSTDSSGTTTYNYSGGDGDSTGAAGNTGTESAWAKQKRLEKEARDKAAAEAAAAAGPKTNADGMLINEDGQIIIGGRAGSGKGKRSHETDAEYAAREHPMFSNKELDAMRGGDKNMHRRPGESAEDYHKRLTGVSEGSEGEGNETSYTAPTEPQVWTDWEGNEYDNPADAEEANMAATQGARDTKIGEIGEYEHGETGTGYADAYQQMLADAYTAAQRGANREIMQLGYDPGTGVTEADLAEQQEWLTGLGTAYEAQNKAMYDAWYKENQDALDAFTGEGSIQAIQDYEWTDAPAYDLDYTGGSAYGSDGAYDADYIPEFFTGYNLEYDPGYKDPNMPDEWGGYGEGEGPSEDDEGESVSSGPPGSAAPMQMMGPKKKTKIKAPTSVGLNPTGRGSAKYN
ncbi:uncharacterized protein METZ01_LOCUS276328, partial [marine metagenome]